jgi:hypothetical protein
MINDVNRNVSLFTFTGRGFNSKFRSIVDYPIFGGLQNFTINENGDPLSEGFDVGNLRIDTTNGGFFLQYVESYSPVPGDPKRRMQLESAITPIIYPDGTTKNTFEPPTVSLADLQGAVAAVYTLVVLLCLLFVGSAVFIIMNKEIVILKVTSWYVNSFILLSLCLIVISTTPTYLTPNFINCTSRILVFSFGFTLIGSLLFLKNYRVWRIFCSKTFEQKYVLSDKQLLLFSLGICALDIILVIIWMAVLRPGPTLTFNGEEFHFFCDAAAINSMNALAWVICMAVKVPIILVGAAISVMNRNIVDQKFNESIVTGTLS